MANFTVNLKLKFKMWFCLVNQFKKQFLQEGFDPNVTWLSPLETKYNKKKGEMEKKKCNLH